MKRSALASALIASTFLTGCSNGTKPSGGGDLGVGDLAMSSTSPFAAKCATCHGPGAEGDKGPNITSSLTAGIGSWTQAQFTTALRMGIDKNGRALCSDMPRWQKSQLSDADLALVWSYLQSVKSDTPNRGSLCGGGGSTDGGVPLDLAAPGGDLASSADFAIKPPDLTPGSSDMAMASPDMTMAPPDMTMAPPDMTMAPPDMTMAPPDMVLPTCTVLINEVRLGTAAVASDEFVEIYNPCPTAQSLMGLKLVYRGGATMVDAIYFTFPSAASIAPQGFYLLQGAGYTGTTTADGTLSSGLNRDNGGLAIATVATPTTYLDKMAWGATTTNGLFVGMPAAAPMDAAAPGRTLARIPDGKKTGNTSTEFVESANPTPRAANMQ
jgi:cytochrome c553